MKWLMALLVWVWMSPLQATAAEYQVGPIPGWVQPLQVDLTRRPASGQSSGEWNLLSDVQTRIEKIGKISYHHYANMALDADGVHDVADISFVFDPSFEQLTIHAIHVLRGGRVIDKLASAKISVLQRETELEYRVYDGSKTVSVVLDDLRVGDVVEYAYSRRGINPVFGNRVAGGAELQWSVPVGYAAVRLLVPNGRKVALQLSGSTLEAQTRELDGYREYRWAQPDVPALKVEDGAPSNFNPYARVRWSEFADWKAVVDWGIPLYRTDGQLGQDLDAVVDNIRIAEATPEARARAVLQKVQSDIRYLGVEVGTGSYVPTAPAIVFKRRFGDCKDKALLVLAMLRKLGIDAVPALVNTKRREAIADALPAPNLFNHVVVRATINGRHYWLDPTSSPQGGDLDNMVQSDHGLALVLAAGETGLSKMAGRDGRNRKQIYAVFDGMAGPGKPMLYTIKTVSYGLEADDIRNQFARRGLKDMQSQYLSYYERRYADISVAEPLQYSDDLQLNRFTTLESYEIKDFWKRPDPKKRREGYIRSSEIRSLLDAPDNLNRIAPLRTNYPEDIEEVTGIKLPGDWGIKPTEVAVVDPAFEYTHKTERGEGDFKYLLTDRLKWRKPQVEPGEVRSYAANLRKAHNEVGFTLYLGNPQPPAGGKPRAREPLMSAESVRDVAVVFAGWCILALCCWRSPQAHRSHNWQLWIQFVWITAALMALPVAMPFTWKAQTLALVVIFLGSSTLRYLAKRAPETHWQHAHAHPEKLASRGVVERYLVYGFNLLPALSAMAGAGYYFYALTQ